MFRSRIVPALVPALLLAGAGCTVVKPVTCAVVHPVRCFAELWDQAGDADDEDEYKEMPTALGLAEGVVLLPVFWVYQTCVGAVGGLFTGVVSDLNVLTGHADLDSTLDTVTDPRYTNALPGD